MCWHCEAAGLLPVTTQVVSFAKLEDALAYGNRQAFKYLVHKQLALLHLFGLVNMTSDLFAGGSHA